MKILRVDADERKIGLSRKRVEWGEEDLGGEEGSTNGSPAGTPPELKGGVGSTSGPLFKPASQKQEATSAESAEADQAEG